MDVVLELTGALTDSSGFQSSDDQLRQLIAALNQIQGISASALRMPVESGPFNNLNTKINAVMEETEFTIRIVMEADA